MNLMRNRERHRVVHFLEGKGRQLYRDGGVSFCASPSSGRHGNESKGQRQKRVDGSPGLVPVTQSRVKPSKESTYNSRFPQILNKTLFVGWVTINLIPLQYQNTIFVNIKKKLKKIIFFWNNITKMEHFLLLQMGPSMYHFLDRETQFPVLLSLSPLSLCETPHLFPPGVLKIWK